MALDDHVVIEIKEDQAMFKVESMIGNVSISLNDTANELNEN